MSIKDHALLVSLYIGKPQLTKKDDKATNDAEAANNARGAGQYRKDLYPRHLVAPIVAVESAARAYIDGTTFPWRRGADVLPMARFMAFTDVMGKFETQFWQSVTAFLNNWSNVMSEAQRQQGDLFAANEYPDMSELRAEFEFRVSYMPITDTGDFRVGIQEDELAVLRAAVERDTHNSIETLMKEPLVRLRKVVEKLAEATGKDREVINKKTGERETRAAVFRDSLIDNIVEEISLIGDFADMLPDDIKNIAGVAKDVCTPHPDALRVDPDLRAKTNTNAKMLLAAIEEMMA